MKNQDAKKMTTPKPLFNGQRSHHNAVIRANMEMELRYKHLIRFTTLRNPPTMPDRVAKLTTHFLNAVGWQDPNTNRYLVHENGEPLTWAEIQAQDQALADLIAGGPGAVAPNATHLYGNNVAARRQAHTDYVSDQKSIRGTYKMHEEQVTQFFEVISSHCTIIGREVFRPYLPTENNPGNTAEAWNAINERMGIDAANSLQPLLQQYQNVKITNDIPTFFTELEALERALFEIGHNVDPALTKGLISRALKRYQNPETNPYDNILDMVLIHPEIALDEFKNLILLKEQSLLATYPRTSSGRKPGGGQTSGQIRSRPAFHQYDSDEEARRRDRYRPMNNTNSSRAASESITCSLCKERHPPRQCPKAWWCEKCKWMHLNNDLCDGGASKREWYNARDAQKPPRHNPKSGGGSSNTEYPKSGGGAMNSRR